MKKFNWDLVCLYMLGVIPGIIIGIGLGMIIWQSILMFL